MHLDYNYTTKSSNYGMANEWGDERDVEGSDFTLFDGIATVFTWRE
jgi:hypothetical protein